MASRAPTVPRAPWATVFGVRRVCRGGTLRSDRPSAWPARRATSITMLMRRRPAPPARSVCSRARGWRQRLVSRACQVSIAGLRTRPRVVKTALRATSMTMTTQHRRAPVAAQASSQRGPVVTGPARAARLVSSLPRQARPALIAPLLGMTTMPTPRRPAQCVPPATMHSRTRACLALRALWTTTPTRQRRAPRAQPASSQPRAKDASAARRGNGPTMPAARAVLARQGTRVRRARRPAGSSIPLSARAVAVAMGVSAWIRAGAPLCTARRAAPSAC